MFSENAILDSLESRYDTLSGLQARLEMFVDTLNNFYQSKEVQFHVRRGLRVLTPNGDRIAAGDATLQQLHL